MRLKSSRVEASKLLRAKRVCSDILMTSHRIFMERWSFGGSIFISGVAELGEEAWSLRPFLWALLWPCEGSMKLVIVSRSCYELCESISGYLAFQEKYNNEDWDQLMNPL